MQSVDDLTITTNFAITCQLLSSSNTASVHSLQSNSLLHGPSSPYSIGSPTGICLDKVRVCGFHVWQSANSYDSEVPWPHFSSPDPFLGIHSEVGRWQHNSNTGHGNGSSDSTFGYGNSTGYGDGRPGTNAATVAMATAPAMAIVAETTQLAPATSIARINFCKVGTHGSAVGTSVQTSVHLSMEP